MNEKLNIQDLSAWLVSENGLSKEEADKFIKEFFQVIEDALEREKYVKIKGLGVFKLIEVEPRESVNINTKERFEIPGYTKVSFTPDPTLRDIINKPFAHFETVALNENTVFDEKEEDKIESEETSADSVLIVEDSSKNDLQEKPDENSIQSPQKSKKTSDEGQEEQLGFVDVGEHKSKTKLYVILTGLVLLLLVGIFFYASRYRMAYEKMDKSEMEILSETDSLQNDSLKAEESDTIQFVSARTSLGGRSGE